MATKSQLPYACFLFLSITARHKTGKRFLSPIRLYSIENKNAIYCKPTISICLGPCKISLLELSNPMGRDQGEEEMGHILSNAL